MRFIPERRSSNCRVDRPAARTASERIWGARRLAPRANGPWPIANDRGVFSDLRPPISGSFEATYPWHGVALGSKRVYPRYRYAKQI